MFEKINMFVRTKNGISDVEYIIDAYRVKDENLVGGECFFSSLEKIKKLYQTSENLEELIKGGDLIIVSDSNDNKLPMIYEKYYFDCWCKTHDNLISKMEWYIKNGNDYKLVGTKQGKGEWKLYER